MNAGTLWNRLADAGLLAGGQSEAPPEARLQAPWYIRLMLGFAGWIAALFLLGFVAAGLSWIIENRAVALVTGVGLMAAAGWAYRRDDHNAFVEQFALAFSFAGQALFAFALSHLLDLAGREAPFWLLMALLQAILALVMDNAIHRGWSGFAGIACLYLAINNTTLEPLLTGVVLAGAAALWLNEFRRTDLAHLVRPVAAGIVAALVAMDLASGLFRGTLGFSAGAATPVHWAWLGQALSGAVLIGVVTVLLRRNGLDLTERRSLVMLGGTLLVVAVSLEAPGIAIGITILLLGFAHGNRVLTGFGILALLLYAGGYYYRLDATLLAKSISLLVTGATLILVRQGVLRHV